MKDFILLFSVYKEIRRRGVVWAVYAKSATSWRIALWLGTISLFAGVVWVGSRGEKWQEPFPLLIVAMFGWMCIFDRARKSAYRHLHITFPEQMKYYGRSYQFIRYRHFLGKCKGQLTTAKIQSALSHAEKQIATEWDSAPSPLSPVSLSITAIVAVLSGFAGRWPGPIAVGIMATLLLFLYFIWFGASIFRSPKVELKEFQRFLHWAAEDLSNPVSK